MNKQKLYWVFQIVGWTTYTFLNVIGINFRSEHFVPVMTLPIIAESIYFFFITHISRKLNKKMEWSKLPTTELIPRLLLGIIILSVTVYLLRVGVSFMLDLYGSEMLSLMNLLGNVMGNTFLLIIWSSIYFTFHYYEQSTQSLKYEVALNEMKLNQLKAQINPTSLKEEITTTKDYLALESIRFEERLQTEFNIDPETENIQVPPMMVQTLVENGIKHGISKLKGGGHVGVKSRVDLGRMILEIRNSGQYHNNRIKGTGQGLRNSRQRLELIYGETAKLEIANENENTVLTTVKIPLFEQKEL
jgi:sensor histidine kinase YesM